MLTFSSQCFKIYVSIKSQRLTPLAQTIKMRGITGNFAPTLFLPLIFISILARLHYRISYKWCELCINRNLTFLVALKFFLDQTDYYKYSVQSFIYLFGIFWSSRMNEKLEDQIKYQPLSDWACYLWGYLKNYFENNIRLGLFAWDHGVGATQLP